MVKKKKKAVSKPRFTATERAAYWYGVGASSALHKDFDYVLESADRKIRNSIVSGYNDDNVKDVSKSKFNKKK